MNPSGTKDTLIRIGKVIFFATVFATALFLVYNQVYNSGKTGPEGLSGYESDTPEHIGVLNRFFEEGIAPPHPLWHILVKLFSFLTTLNVEWSAVIVSASLITLWSYLVFRVVAASLRPRRGMIARSDEPFYLFVTLVILTVGPLCIPFYDHIIFRGQGSPNVWHNVTLWTVKPFALVGMIATVLALRTQTTSYYAAALAAVFVSILAKPSFILVFLPALYLLVLSRHYGSRRNLCFIALMTLLSGAVLLFQFMHTFTGDSKIVFDFLGVWSLQSKNVVVSILLGLAFPLVLLRFHPQIMKNDYIFLSWVQVLLGIGLFAFFAESGSRYTHGNFGWSYIIAMGFLYLFSIVAFFKDYHAIGPFKRSILNALLGLQTMTGMYYLLKVLEGQNPLYISLFFD